MPLLPGITLLDIGSGAGFPLLEIAQRLGTASTCYGLDPWTNANERAKLKMNNYDVQNVQIIDGSADAIPFPENTFDLIVSNLGINNFTNPALVIKECHRTLKPNGLINITTNLNGHWRPFYQLFTETLHTLHRTDLIASVHAQEAHRGTVASSSADLQLAGLTITRTFSESFEMRFLDGTAFLNHYFIKLGWLQSWKDLIPATLRQEFFAALEHNLNEHAKKEGCLALPVPMAFIEAQKI
jgi:SAM-dependent methyltransferase